MGTDVDGFLLDRRRIDLGFDIILSLWIKISDLSRPCSGDVNILSNGINETLGVTGS